MPSLLLIFVRCACVFNLRVVLGYQFPLLLALGVNCFVDVSGSYGGLLLMSLLRVLGNLSSLSTITLVHVF